jgi:formylglycine-generating enzyme required for sulfatase activity
MTKENRNKIGLVLSGIVATLALAIVSIWAEGTNTVGAPPVIIKQPKSVAVAVGETATFGVEGSKDWVVQCSESVKMDLIYIQPGTFTMGSPTSELGRGGNETQHTVTLTKGYWLGKYEVTQAQWKAVMGSNPSYWKGDNLPVEQVSWNDIMGSEGFCAKLTAAEKAAGRLPEGYAYTLPTEAQWEYACRAGTTTALNSGKNLTQEYYNCPNLNEVGWYTSNSSSKTHVVGQKLPNAWGLYDMHGNVWEWCKDRYGTYPTGAVSDPTGPSVGFYRVFRGGGWGSNAGGWRSAFRGYYYPYYSHDSNGFRLALSLVQ